MVADDVFLQIKASIPNYQNFCYLHHIGFILYIAIVTLQSKLIRAHYLLSSLSKYWSNCKSSVIFVFNDSYAMKISNRLVYSINCIMIKVMHLDYYFNLSFRLLL